MAELGESGFTVVEALIFFWVLVVVGLAGLAVYAAIHFIAKVW